MDESETTRLRALLEGATQGKWRNNELHGDVMVTAIVDDAGDDIALLSRRSAAGLACDDHEAWTNGDLIVAAVNALPGLLDAAERAERAERERDDLAAVLETRTAEHALAMARVTELEAIIAGRTTPPTDDELVAMETVGLRLARRWHAVDKAGNVRAFPTAEVSRG